jgi:GTP-binding protein YchF
MKIGIVGLPNVGKSTLFKALTKKQVDISNYPFCTINPNVGVVEIPDERLDKLAQIYNSQKVVHAIIEFVDIAGLVKKAHQGEGLGNQFLSHIREVDAIIHLIRRFKDENITHVEGKIDPDSDKKTIETELAMADIQSLEKILAKLDKKIKANDKSALKQKIILENIQNDLDKGKSPDLTNLKDEEKKFVKSLNLLSLKPELYIENIDEKDLNNPKPSLPDSIPICAKLEAELTDLENGEAKKYLEELGIKKSGLSQLITRSYKLLDLITFFTLNPNEAHAWTITRGARAPQAAGKVHTDFEKGFIRAEVVNWQTLLDTGSETAAKEKGLIRTEGKEYVVQNGDVIYFRFNK